MKIGHVRLRSYPKAARKTVRQAVIGETPNDLGMLIAIHTAAEKYGQLPDTIRECGFDMLEELSLVMLYESEKARIDAA